MKTSHHRTMTVLAQEQLRIRVVRAIVEQGLSQAESCRTFGVGKASVWRWMRHADRKVFLIVDRHSVHRSKKVSQWIARHAEQLARLFLPGHNPELNPDEPSNQDVKSNAIGRRRPNTQTEMIDNLRSYLRSTQKQPHVVKAYFQEPHVRYAADTA